MHLVCTMVKISKLGLKYLMVGVYVWFVSWFINYKFLINFVVLNVDNSKDFKVCATIPGSWY